MAQVERAPALPASFSREMKKTVPLQIPSSAMTTLPPPPNSVQTLRNAHLNLDSFSPVNQNGSYEFDRVLKSGYVEKRTRKTKTWKRIYLVLRPNLLSIYKDQNETKLRHKIHLSELTAVAYLKDPKQKRQNVFGLFSPSRNYHLEAKSKQDAEEWVELIRQEARIEEEEEEMFLASPGGHATGTYSGFERSMKKQREARNLHDERLGTSSPEPSDPIPRRLSKVSIGPVGSQRRTSHTYEYSGNELASHSDMSEGEPQREMGASTISIPIPEETSADEANGAGQAPKIVRNASQMSGFNTEQDPERVIWQGYLMYLKSSKGVKQWKELWAVLRARNLALYKDDAEYSPRLIIPLSSIINAVEIDPISRTKIHCMQVITEEKSYRFCAHSEESLDNSLGAFKSLLAKRKDKENEAKRPVGIRS